MVKLPIPMILFTIFIFSANSFAQTLAKPEAYGGVGILLDHDPKDPQKILIFSVTYKSPADKAQVHRGDRLLSVDGQEVTGHDLNEIADKIRGPLGSSVTLMVETTSGVVRGVTLERRTIAAGPLVSVPPPNIGSTGVFFTSEERALVKEKILGLTTDEKRENMLNLLKALKEKRITKTQFLKFLKTDF